jgi:hypothetical protein
MGGTGQETTRRGSLRVRRRIVAACLTGCLVVGVAAFARADPIVPGGPDTPTAPDPYRACEDGSLAGQCLDTDQTPTNGGGSGKTTDLFQQVAGAHFGEDKAAYENRVRETAITSFDDSLYTVAFSEQQGAGGIAAGATCDDPEPYHESGCRPVLYQYKTFNAIQGNEWRKIDLPGQDSPGYIGKVAWIGRTGKALAVGGTGTYPRREPANDAKNDKGEPCNPADAPPNAAYGYNCDQAGMARVWLYDPERFSDHGGWCELGPSSECGEIPSGPNGQRMRGLTALAFDSNPSDELGFAAGLGQIWKWDGGRFSGQMVDSSSPECVYDKQTAASCTGTDGGSTLELAQFFRFRVRDIRFVPGVKVPIAVAITAGCCSATPLTDAAAMLTYASDGQRQRQWHLYHLNWELEQGFAGPANVRPVENTAGVAPNTHPERPDSLYSLTVEPIANVEVENNARWTFKLSAVTSPGGPERSGEPASTISARYCRGGAGAAGQPSLPGAGDPWLSDLYDYSTRANLSTARLVAGDGDTAVTSFQHFAPIDPGGEIDGTPATNSSTSFDILSCGVQEGRPKGALGGDSPDFRTDAVPDWVVGALRSTRRAGLGDRGLLVANPQRPSLYPKTLNPGSGSACSPSAYPYFGATCTTAPTTSELTDQGYKPTDQAKLQTYLASQYYLLPSYGLDAIDIIGDSSSGWAVGDHGAILSLDSAKATASVPEPDPPKLGSHGQSQLPDNAPYEGPSSSASEPGQVPALSSRPVIDLSEPQLLPAGSTDPSGPGEYDPAFAGAGHGINQIAMSRDGSEGWAVGPHVSLGSFGSLPPGAMSLYHYDGSTWTLCDPLGTPHVKLADPACASLAALTEFRDQKGNNFSVKLRAIARVPLEDDSDPSNDDQFEAVAIGSLYYPANARKNTSGDWYAEPTVLRYRDGRWRREDSEAMASITEALSATSLNSSGLSDVAFTAPDDGWALTSSGSLFHFDGNRWIDCSSASCFDGAGRTVGLAISTFGGTYSSLALVSAGRRIYLYGARNINNVPCLAVIYHDKGASSWHGSADGSDGGFDPGWDPNANKAMSTCPSQGQIAPASLAVAERPGGGGYEGWLVGRTGTSASSSAVLLRLAPDRGWQPYPAPGVLGDYLGGGAAVGAKMTAMVPVAGGFDTYLADSQGRLFRFASGHDRWALLLASRPQTSGSSGPDGTPAALAPDSQGGVWFAAVDSAGSGGHQYLYHYTDHPHQQVFSELANPAGQRIVTSATAGAKGQFWLTTDSDLLYRYDRASGWDAIHVRGWDPGRVVTTPSRAEAIAINRQGTGVVVGEDGRIADIAGAAVKLDDAAGAPTICSLAKPPPCGTGRNLKTAAVAPDGSAMVGGDGLTILWRGAGGSFQAISRPDAAAQTTITGISMPGPNRAWVTTDTGFVFAGKMAAPGQWSWDAESYAPDGTPLTVDRLGSSHYTPLRAVAIDGQGQGIAVGDRGVVLQRNGDGKHPWHRLDSPYLDNFTTVALNPNGADAGGLLGAERGAIYAWNGQRIELVRAGEWPHPLGPLGTARTWTLNRPVAGLAILGGSHPGETEAWAAIEGSTAGDSSLLHYASDPTDPRLNPQSRAEALADSPKPASGDLSFAAFGHTLCAGVQRQPRCTEMGGTTEDYDLFAHRIVSALAGSASAPGGPQFSLFSGDLADQLGSPPSSSDKQGRLKTARFSDFVADPLAKAGAPLFGAIGGGDLSGGASTCATGFYCSESSALASAAGVSAGENLAWRRGMANMPWPHGGEEQLSESGDLTFNAVPDSATAKRPESVPGTPAVKNPADGSVLSPEAHPATDTAGGAPTHYAIDVARGGQKLARLVFVDSSLGSITASDPIQNPIEPKGQLGPAGKGGWLESVLCFEGKSSTTGDPCTRAQGERAIVVTNTPTYSYGPGGLTNTQQPSDALAFEQALFDGQVSLVVSGRIGWNGLYYARDTAGRPADHFPAPGGAYPDRPADPLPGGDKPIPFLIASGAGRFSQQASDTSAPAGFWHGYSLVHLDPQTGDVQIEQRPILDWISLAGSAHVLRPGQSVKLSAKGREPVATIAGNGNLPVVRDDEISNAAITHRFDLVKADPEKPWLPLTDDKSSFEHHYVPLEGQHCDEPGDHPVGCIDSQSGQVQAGTGAQERTFALAILSVGEKVATYPLVFEPRPSFRQAPAPPAISPPPAQAPPPAPAPPAPAPPFNPPTLATPPPLAPLPAQTPPVPPAPPAPPTGGPAQLDLFTSPPALSVAPSISLFPPAPPVINVAPPTPARPVEKAKKVAVQSSGSDSDAKAGKSQAQMMGGDLANAPDAPDHAMTRNDPNAFTAVAHREQASAWARDLQWGGGLTLMALVMAFGWITVRPTPRRRTPEVPAPAWAKRRR